MGAMKIAGRMICSTAKIPMHMPQISAQSRRTKTCEARLTACMPISVRGAAARITAVAMELGRPPT
jgi:hypothetical protein